MRDILMNSEEHMLPRQFKRLMGAARRNEPCAGFLVEIERHLHRITRPCEPHKAAATRSRCSRS